jgi:glutamate-5-semialdehyde dehydrogenase
MGLHEEMLGIGDRAKAAAAKLNLLNTKEKNEILHAMASGLDNKRADILAANGIDIEAGKKSGLSDAMLDRLFLDDARIDGMIDGLKGVADLDDPIGEQLEKKVRPNGIEIIKERVPIGVIGIIYESRPNVTSDTAGLCLKTSNATILRGGKESIRSNSAIAKALIEGGKQAGLPDEAIQLIETIDRAAVKELVQMEGRVDLVIPRGGESLVRAVTELARVPVIKHYKGICHVYVDKSADIEMALSIVKNAKCQRPGVCNAIETLLVNKEISDDFLPRVTEMLKENGVEMRGDATAKKTIADIGDATEDDWSAEYLDLILAIKVVDSVGDAISHINKYGSGHSDAIITNDDSAAKEFTHQVDSAAVYVNASTRFTDGGEFGMGAEIGISTDKLHARGPMGLEGLTSYKYIIHGTGQVR